MPIARPLGKPRGGWLDGWVEKGLASTARITSRIRLQVGYREWTHLRVRHFSKWFHLLEFRRRSAEVRWSSGSNFFQRPSTDFCSSVSISPWPSSLCPFLRDRSGRVRIGGSPHSLEKSWRQNSSPFQFERTMHSFSWRLWCYFLSRSWCSRAEPASLVRRRIQSRPKGTTAVSTRGERVQSQTLAWSLWSACRPSQEELSRWDIARCPRRSHRSTWRWRRPKPGEGWRRWQWKTKTGRLGSVAGFWVPRRWQRRSSGGPF